MTQRKLLVLGGSIANGMGLRTAPTYAEIVADQLDLEVVDYTDVSMPIQRTVEMVEESDIAPEVALVMHGATESMLRPPDAIVDHLPRSWRRTKLDPRPWYSTRRRKRVAQRVDSALRWRVKVWIMRLFGSHQTVPTPVYAERLDTIAEELEARGTQVVVLQTPDICERTFPGSSEAGDALTAAPAHGVDVYTKGKLELWDDYLPDRLHPNAIGHEKIAEAVLEVLEDKAARDTPEA